MRPIVRQVAVYALAAPAVGVVVAALASMSADRLPQVARGDDALAVLFGDARETISYAFVHKADSYFHGGIDMECKHLGEHDDHDHKDCHDRHDHVEETHAAFDLWRWINTHVRAPEQHVHLDGEKSVELMPWFWAAVRADPHNVDAWTSAAYAADRMVKDKALARRIIDEAKARNPHSLEIAFAEARFVYDGGKGDVASAERLLEHALELGSRKCDGLLSELSERDAETCRRIQEYLSGIRKARSGGSRP